MGFGFFGGIVITIGLFKVVNRMFYQLPLTAKILYLLALSNPLFNCYMYIFAMVTSLFLDFILHYDSWLVEKYH